MTPPAAVSRVIQYWHSPDPPRPIAELLESFPSENPGLRQIVFNRSSAEEFIAEHLPASRLDAFRACVFPASQADLLRYCAGYVLGGLCVDADVHCIGDLGMLTETAEDGVLVGRREPLPEKIERSFGWPYRVGAYRAVPNGLFAFAEPGHPLLALAIEIAVANIEAGVGDGRAAVWQTTGPGVFTSIYLLHQLGSVSRFLDYTAGTALEPTARLSCETVGSWSRVERALERVEIIPLDSLDGIVRHVKVTHPDCGAHWSRAEGRIFR